MRLSNIRNFEGSRNIISITRSDDLVVRQFGDEHGRVRISMFSYGRLGLCLYAAYKNQNKPQRSGAGCFIELAALEARVAEDNVVVSDEEGTSLFRVLRVDVSRKTAVICLDENVEIVSPHVNRLALLQHSRYHDDGEGDCHICGGSH
jgi:hypothetical protein